MMKNYLSKIGILFMTLFSLSLFADTLTIEAAFQEVNVFDKKSIASLKIKTENDFKTQSNFKNAVKLVLLSHNYALAVQKETTGKTVVEEAYLKAKELFNQFKHPIFLIYLGSLETMKGNVEADPSLKMAWVNKGLAHMDQAVNDPAAKNDAILQAYIRTVRGINNSNLPEFFGRLATAKEDLAWVYENAYKIHPKSFQKENGAVLLFSLGKVNDLSGEKDKARFFYQECKNKYPKSNQAKEAENKLK